VYEVWSHLMARTFSLYVSSALSNRKLGANVRADQEKEFS